MVWVMGFTPTECVRGLPESAQQPTLVKPDVPGFTKGPVASARLPSKRVESAKIVIMANPPLTPVASTSLTNVSCATCSCNWHLQRLAWGNCCHTNTHPCTRFLQRYILLPNGQRYTSRSCLTNSHKFSFGQSSSGEVSRSLLAASS